MSSRVPHNIYLARPGERRNSESPSSGDPRKKDIKTSPMPESRREETEEYVSSYGPLKIPTIHDELWK